MTRTTTSIAVTDLVRLLDQIAETKALAEQLASTLAELVEGHFVYVKELDVFTNARKALEAARKGGVL